MSKKISLKNQSKGAEDKSSNDDVVKQILKVQEEIGGEDVAIFLKEKQQEISAINAEMISCSGLKQVWANVGFVINELSILQKELVEVRSDLENYKDMNRDLLKSGDPNNIDLYYTGVKYINADIDRIVKNINNHIKNHKDLLLSLGLKELVTHGKNIKIDLSSFFSKDAFAGEYMGSKPLDEINNIKDFDSDDLTINLD